MDGATGKPYATQYRRIVDCLYRVVLGLIRSIFTISAVIRAKYVTSPNNLKFTLNCLAVATVILYVQIHTYTITYMHTPIHAYTVTHYIHNKKFKHSHNNIIKHTG